MSLLDIITTLWLAAGEHIDVPGGLGMAFGFAASLMPRRRRILQAAACSGLCFGVHFLSLGSATGTAMCLIGVGQNLLAARYGGRPTRPPWMTPVFMAALLLALAITLATWQGLPSLLACAGAVLSTFARLQASHRRMRNLFLCSSSCWAGHNVLMVSVCGLTCDVLTIIGFAIAALRDRAHARGHGHLVPARG